MRSRSRISRRVPFRHPRPSTKDHSRPGGQSSTLDRRQAGPTPGGSRMAKKLLSRDEQLRHDAILEAIAFAAQRWLETTQWTEANDEVLAALGRATGASRAY